MHVTFRATIAYLHDICNWSDHSWNYTSSDSTMLCKPPQMSQVMSRSWTMQKLELATERQMEPSQEVIEALKRQSLLTNYGLDHHADTAGRIAVNHHRADHEDPLSLMVRNDNVPPSLA